MRIPVLFLFLPITIIVFCMFYSGMEWLAERYTNPWFHRKLYERYCRDMRKSGLRVPTYEEFNALFGSEYE